MKKFLFVILMALCTSVMASGDDSEGSNHHNTYNETTMTTQQNSAVTAEQNSDVRLGATAPGLAGSAYDCNIVSRSYSILIWSYGRSRCEKGSVVWRDVFYLALYAKQLGLSPAGLAEAIKRRVCADRKIRKAVGNCPAKVRVVTERMDTR